MRVASLYDVHGNLSALDAVLRQVPADARILVGGDVAAGPYPQATVDRLRDLGERALWIRGNADRELTAGERGLAPPALMEWIRARIAPETVEWLHALPATLSVEIDGIGRVLFCHATPLSDEDIFTERTPDERIASLFSGVDAELAVCGHTHTQFERTVGGVRVVNSGSVGMAYEDEPGAYWTLLGPDVEPRRTAYELDTGEFPGEWASPSREEAVTFFETRAVTA